VNPVHYAANSIHFNPLAENKPACHATSGVNAVSGKAVCTGAAKKMKNSKLGPGWQHVANGCVLQTLDVLPTILNFIPHS